MLHLDTPMIFPQIFSFQRRHLCVVVFWRVVYPKFFCLEATTTTTTKFETELCCIIRAGLKLSVPLPQPLMYYIQNHAQALLAPNTKNAFINSLKISYDAFGSYSLPFLSSSHTLQSVPTQLHVYPPIPPT